MGAITWNGQRDRVLWCMEGPGDMVHGAWSDWVLSHLKKDNGPGAMTTIEESISRR